MSGKVSPSSSLLIKSKSIKKRRKETDIYSTAIITQIVYIPITNVGRNLDTTLKNIISNRIEGKCITEGYIKPDSIKIISYSNGVQNGYNIVFDIVVECKVCNPVEGMHISCIAKNITKAGIRAQISDDNNPMVIFLARDHNYMSKMFSSIEENQEIKVRVIGQRFELNDTYISVIGELAEVPKSKTKSKLKLQTDETTAPDVMSEEIPSVSSEPASLVEEEAEAETEEAEAKAEAEAETEAETEEVESETEEAETEE